MIERLARPSGALPPAMGTASLPESPVSAYGRDLFVANNVQAVQDRNWQSLSTMFDQMMERHHRLMEFVKAYWQQMLPILKETERREQAALALKAHDQRLKCR